MMGILKACAIAVSMYSQIPMPHFDWKEEDMKYAICFFPLVGAVIGLLVWGWFRLSEVLSLGSMARTLIGAVLPVWIAGGIHVDGYMDTSDALSSYQTRERRLEILKDSHIGAFAVIRLLILAGVYTAGLSLVSGKAVLVWAIGFFYARALSGLSVVTFKNARKSGTLYAFASGADAVRARYILLGEAALSAVLMVIASPLTGILSAGAGIGVFAYYRWRSYKDFDGITGDLAGWFLCLCELAIVCVAGILSVLMPAV